MHLKYINPMPKNVEEIMGRFKKILVPELNMGQLVQVLNGKYSCNAKDIIKFKDFHLKFQNSLMQLRAS